MLSIVLPINIILFRIDSTPRGAVAGAGGPAGPGGGGGGGVRRVWRVPA